MICADTEASGQQLAETRRRLWISLGLLLAGIAVLTGLAWQSVTNMVTIWLNDSAYNHGLFVLPIAAFMAWERRQRLAGQALEPFWPGLIIVAGFAAAWLIARGAAIMEGEQLAYVGMIQGLILTVLGRKIFRSQLLPIMYLWLLVPTGGFLLPSLQAIATWLAVHLLHLTSIPFFAEQFYIQLPVGLFFVAPGCAGLNFLLAALALSIVYSELMYQGWKRKITCILVWLGVAVLANGFRIFAILWLAEISNKKLAIVDDHLLYGWGFFFIILIGLMIAGQRFSNMPPLSKDAAPTSWVPSRAASIARVSAAAMIPVLIISAVLGYGLVAFSQVVRMQGVTLTAPDNINGWQLGGNMNYPESAFPNADARRVLHFENANIQANLFVAYYAGQWDGHEAASDNNNIFGGLELKITGRDTPELVVNGVRRRVAEETVDWGPSNILIWRWYCVDGHSTASAFEVRLRTAANRMLLRKSSASVITLFAIESDAARSELTALMQAISTAKPGLMVADAEGNETAKANCW